MAEAASDQETAKATQRRATKRTAKRSSSTKASAKKAPAKKASTTKARAKTTSVKETGAAKASAKKASATEASAKKASPKKSTSTKTNAQKVPAKKTSAKKTTKKTAPQSQDATAPTFDRSQLVDKIRVHLLAKLLGVTSRELTSALRDMGLKKVAQSTLSLEESNSLIDHLEAQPAGADQPEQPQQPEQPKQSKQPKKSKKSKKQSEQSAGQSTPPTQQSTSPTQQPKQSEEQSEQPTETGNSAESEEALEKLKYRVGKNVENEIHQIEQKVDRELEARRQEQKKSQAEDNDHHSEDADEDGFTDLDEEAFEDSRSAYDRNLDVAEAIADAPIFLAPQNTLNRSTSEQSESQDAQEEHSQQNTDDAEDSESSEGSPSRRRRRGRRGTRRGRGAGKSGTTEHTHSDGGDHSEEQAEPDDYEPPTEPVAIKGSTRLEAQRRRRSEMRQKGREKRHIVSQAEFLARRESVERIMVVHERQRHDHEGRVTQVGVLEDGMLVEHFVTNEDQSSMIGNIYLGRVQNVLPSMEAAFVDIGTGRNGVLYSGEVDWKSAGLGGRGRRIEQALHPGDQILVQVTKDPLGHKGARLTTQISLPGRYLVYVPGGRSSGISRKLPIPERKRLKEILKHVMPEDGGAIIRTAAEGVSEEAIAADVERLHKLWIDITTRSESAHNSKAVTLYEEPNVLVKVIRDLFNEDFTRLIVDGDRSWNIVNAYVHSVAPDLVDRLEKWDRLEHEDADVFEHYQINEQLQKALSRKVWLPSGGTLIIDRTEAMTVIDVNTGRFTGSGGNLEETVTSTNLEAAEEIVRQLRLRDIGGMVVIDFIDMVLPENQDLVVRRLTESLGRDRTRHQVSEVTSLGLVQLTRKRLGTGLLETFATECEECGGRGVIVHDDPVEETKHYEKHQTHAKRRPDNAAEHPLFQALKQHKKSDEELVDAVLGDVDEAPEDSTDTKGSLELEDTQKDTQKDTRDARPARRRRVARRNAAHDEDDTAENNKDTAENNSSAQQEADSVDASSSAEQESADESNASVKRRGRRRVRRAMSTRSVSEQDSKEKAEDVAEEAEQESRQPRGRSSRRGIRRAVRRTSARTANESAHAPRRASGRHSSQRERELADARESETSHGAVNREDPAVAERRYAEEKAAFENSPRRRRRVRGHSKSDVPPTPPRSRNK